MSKAKTPDVRDDDKPPQFDDVLKRMLSTPPKQHKDEKVGARKPSPEAIEIAARVLAKQAMKQSRK